MEPEQEYKQRKEAAMKQQPGLLDQVRDAIRVRQYSIRTEEAYTQWIRRSIFFHN